MTRFAVENLWKDAAPPERGERFDELTRLGNTRIERIVSSEHPAPDVQDQVQDEWVLLVRGEASLEICGSELELHAGDHLTIPARTPHRVLRTSRDALWLAVHVYPE